jgi:hypothetical protein
MSMVANICTRKILTTGQVPKEGRAGLPPHVLSQGGSSKWPILGFANGTHCDERDKLTPVQCQEWKQKVQENIDSLLPGNKPKILKKKIKMMQYFSRLLEEEDFCLPTTCGYQFVYQGDAGKELEVRAFFKMDGLGAAVTIEHGVMQSFMGAMFSHQTCIPIVRKDGRSNASNSDNNFLVVGWGSNGGAAEVAEANVAAAAAEAHGSVVEEVETAAQVEDHAAGRGGVTFAI